MSGAESIALDLSPDEARELCMALDDRIGMLRDSGSEWRIRQADALDPVLERLWKIRELAAREAAKLARGDTA